MKIALYSYKSPFELDDPKKLRPGFRIGDTLFVLTHTAPHERGSVIISAKSIESEHFKAKSDNVFLTYSTKYPPVKRYNNKIGGYLLFNEEILEFVKNLADTDINPYLITI